MSPRTHYLVKLELPESFARDRAAITMFCAIATVLLFAGFLFVTTGFIDIMAGGNEGDISRELFYGSTSMVLGVGIFLFAFMYLYSQNIK
jgi:hypothetical protein